MKKKYAKPSLFLIVTVVLLCYIAINEPAFMDAQELRYPSVLLESYSETGFYEIDPETILGSLKTGKKNIFTSLKVIPDTPFYSMPFQWEQDDYLAIANALQEFVWQEKPTKWMIHSMEFYGDCKYNPIGFDIVNITYYKKNGLQKYDVRMIGIYPLTRMAAWGLGKNYPHSLFEQMDYIRPNDLAVTVNKALQLAEENGGKASRLAIDNECRISVSLSSSSQKWNIIYSDKSTYSVFDMNINPYTSEFDNQN